MIHLTHESVIRLGVAPADFRCGIDGFAARCRTLLGEEPAGGTLYVFINRARTMIRCLAHDGTGYWLMTKRLSRGRFTGWPTTADVDMTAASARELRALLESGSWRAEPAPRRNALERAASAGPCPVPRSTSSSPP